MRLIILLFALILGLPAYSDMPKARVIINPKSGTENKESLEKLIVQSFNGSFDYEITYTQGPNHASKLSKEAANLGYALVIAVGGDGTINEVGKALIGTNTALGIIPSGSGNGLARHLGIPLEVKDACQIIKQHHYISIDTIKINNDYFLGIAGIGFDAHIAWKFAKSKQRGFKAYTRLARNDYLWYTPQIFEIEIDGKPTKKQGLLISFANSSQYGNNIKIAPDAVLDDGYLQVIVFKKPPLYILPRLLKKLRDGTINTSRYYESISCKEVCIKKGKLKAHIDGEPVLFENGINLKVLPRSLKVIVPT